MDLPQYKGAVDSVPVGGAVGLETHEPVAATVAAAMETKTRPVATTRPVSEMTTPVKKHEPMGVAMGVTEKQEVEADSQISSASYLARIPGHQRRETRCASKRRRCVLVHHEQRTRTELLRSQVFRPVASSSFFVGSWPLGRGELARDHARRARVRVRGHTRPRSLPPTTYCDDAWHEGFVAAR